jgi:methionyl-tRNA formyltransferase
VKLAVAATAPIGADLLERLAARHEVAYLLTRPDSARGRGRKVAPPPAKEAAHRLGIAVHQPDRPELPEPVDAVIVCAYGLYIPPSLLEQALWVNVHPSLLPRWRGAAPVERAILAGDEQTGVTIHRTVEALDAGPIAAQEAFPIGAEDDAGTIFARSAEVAARLLDDVLPEPVFTPQPEEGMTYAEKITAADRELDLFDPIDAWRRVRALSPHIGAWATLEGRRVIVWRARLADGVFDPVEVQPEGSRRMSYGAFLRGVRGHSGE